MPIKSKPTPDGGFWVSGTVNSTIQGAAFFLMKLDANCRAEWVNNTYDILATAHSILPTSDNGFLITGLSRSKAWLMKTDAYGNYTSTSGDIDLELDIFSNSNSFSAFEFHSFTVRVKNNSNQVATGVRIAVPEPAGSVFTGGNEYTASQGSYDPYVTYEWQTGPLVPGAYAYLEINLYTLQEVNPLIAYAQVLAANENDVDSTPGNGTPPAANEDDEGQPVYLSRWQPGS